MSEINFGRYRSYVAARTEANNFMIALLAGSRLAAHSLQLHDESPHQLPGLFPKVRDIDRFNLLPGRATELLLGADSHLAAVAIPYALAVYEAFVKDATELLGGDGRAVDRSRGSMNAGRMHTTFFLAAGLPEPVDTTSLFHVLRCMRNAQIHHAGIVSPELCQAVASLTDKQLERWEKLTMAPVDAMFEQDHIAFSLGHLVASFAVTKEAARSINSALRVALSRTFWARLAVADFQEAATQPLNSTNWKRGLVGFTRFHYRDDLALQEHELEEAARATGAWTRGIWS